MRIPINVIEDHRNDVSKVPLPPTTVTDVLNEPFETRPASDANTAVAPGSYVHPGATVEDMYRPELNARTATGTVTVTE